MKIKVSNYIARRLVEEGISQVFSVTGGGAMHLNDGLGHQPGLHVTYNHHEQASAIAAECYARIHGKIAALCVTTGPGGTNAITGVLGGWLDSIPMLVLSGQVRYDTTARSSGVGIRAMGDQEFDICLAIGCMTKYSEMVINPMRIRFALEKALYLAYSGRPGPCWLDIPLNVQGAYVEEDELVGFDSGDYERGGTGWAAGGTGHAIPEDAAGQGEKRQALPPKVDGATARQIIEKIRASKRPVFNGGNGIRIAGAHDVFLRVVEKLGIPVVTGWDSEDLMADEHPLYVGRAGNFGDRPGNFAVENSDLLLSVGSRLSIRQVGYNYKSWAWESYTIVNDIDPEELKKPSLHVDMPVFADAKDLLEALERELDAEGSGVAAGGVAANSPAASVAAGGAAASGAATSDTGRDAGAAYGDAGTHTVFGGGEGLPGKTWLETCAYWKEKYPVVLPKHLERRTGEAANVYAFIHALSSVLPEGQVTVVGNGSACVVGGHAYHIKGGQRFITNSAVAAMGYDLPAAIGASYASPGEEIILVTGDGSIQMNLQELQTIIHHQLPIKIFLINNGGYHSIRQTQKNFFEGPLVGIGVDSGDLSFPSMEKLAGAYGYPYLAIGDNAGIPEAVDRALHTKGPVICEVFVTTGQSFEPKSATKKLPDGTLVSPPLEDLWPFLSDEEMAANMIVKRNHAKGQK
ncbi:MAG: thiamine pyrophosphate-binding protein [Lachnospiraceae bacterium]|jgi:acetolactate synthase-1/2/3 large subunit|nr:thiamine pyrophosphate-binding protein [Lachnospiraceae bacterium]